MSPPVSACWDGACLGLDSHTCATSNPPRPVLRAASEGPGPAAADPARRLARGDGQQRDPRRRVPGHLRPEGAGGEQGCRRGRRRRRRRPYSAGEKPPSAGTSEMTERLRLDVRDVNSVVPVPTHRDI